MSSRQFSFIAFSVLATITALLLASGNIAPEFPLLTRLLMSEFGAIFSLGMVWYSIRHYQIDRLPLLLMFAFFQLAFFIHFFWYGWEMWYQAFLAK